MKITGFSLIEIICTLCLISIIFVSSVPLSEHFFENTKIDMIQSQLLHAIEWARTEALVQAELIFLCGSSDGKQCSGDWRSGFMMYSNEKIIDYFKNPVTHGALHFRSFPVHHPYLNFFPSGIDNMQNGTFWYCESGVSYPRWAIMIAQSGYARLIRPNNMNAEIIDSRQEALKCS